MYQPLICFQDDPSSAHTPQNVSFPPLPLHTHSAVSLLLLSPFTAPSLSPPPPLLLLSPRAVFTLSPHCPLLSLPALSVLQLVVLKVWSVGRLVVGGNLGACAVPLNMLCFPHKHTKGSSLIKTLCFSSPHVPKTHRPSPKTHTTERDPSYGNSSLPCGC